MASVFVIVLTLIVASQPALAPTLASYDASVPFADGPRGAAPTETSPVGSFGVANAFGLSDMHGNVAEWCLDGYEPNFEKFTDAVLDNPWNVGTKPYPHVARGGSWDDEVDQLRIAQRKPQFMFIASVSCRQYLKPLRRAIAVSDLSAHYDICIAPDLLRHREIRAHHRAGLCCIACRSLIESVDIAVQFSSARSQSYRFIFDISLFRLGSIVVEYRTA